MTTKMKREEKNHSQKFSAASRNSPSGALQDRGWGYSRKAEFFQMVSRKATKSPCLCWVQGNNLSPPGSDCTDQPFPDPYSSSKLSCTTWHSLSCSFGLFLATKLITPSALTKYSPCSYEAKLVSQQWLSAAFPLQALRGCSAISL